MKKIWKIIDHLICKYAGIDKQEMKLNHLEMIGSQVLISNTEPFKRHQHTQKIEDFFANNFDDLNSSHKKKLGMALGQILAKNLIVSFEKTNIKEIR